MHIHAKCENNLSKPVREKGENVICTLTTTISRDLHTVTWFQQIRIYTHIGVYKRNFNDICLADLEKTI